ncbi:MAG: hypothetical protein ACRESZ_09450 [Methylococcales bacterium]
MKSPIALGTTVTAILLGTFGVAPQTLATPYTNTSGEICKNYYGSEANIIHYTDGTRSGKAGSTFVICPLSRGTTNSNGAFIYVDVKHNSSATITCNAYSKSYTGNFLASDSQTWTGSGFHEFALDLAGSGYSDLYSDYSVICLIPGYVGSVIGVDLSEQ